jgi:Iron-sulfur cluster-binding domain
MTRRPISECHHPWEWLVVDPLGWVRPCCYASRPIGNLNDQTIEELWNGADMVRLRASIRDGYINKVCRHAACSFVRNTEKAFGAEAQDFRFPINEEVSANDMSETDHFVSGWSSPEAWGIWTDGPEAALRLDLTGTVGGSGNLNILCRGIGHEIAPKRTVQILINNRKLATWQFLHPHETTKMEWRTLNIPHDVIANGMLEILFRIDKPISPRAWGVDDGRSLGFAFSAMKVSVAGVIP